MDVHKNAPLTPAGREAMVRRVVEDGQTPQAVSAAVGVCPRTVRKWVDRFRAEPWRRICGTPDAPKLAHAMSVRQLGGDCRNRDLRVVGCMCEKQRSSGRATSPQRVRHTAAIYISGAARDFVAPRGMRTPDLLQPFPA